jgi:hypothetical protein
LGSWRADKHLKKTPAALWRDSLQKGENDVPKLCISSFSMHFTAEISEFDLNLFTDEPSDNISSTDCSTLCMSHKVTTTTTETEQVDKNGEIYTEAASLSNLLPTEFPFSLEFMQQSIWISYYKRS